MFKKLPNWLTQAIQQQADVSWHPLLYKACQQLPEDYLTFLTTYTWLPGKEKIFNAFCLPLSKTKYILYGESPYPRAASANGCAFWDAVVKEIWSEKGLSKTVNRATSLRNFIKMLINAGSSLPAQRSNPGLDLKPGLLRCAGNDGLVQTLDELFQNLLNHGFLLLNFNLSLSDMPKNKEAKYWMLFHQVLLEEISHHIKPQLVLFGKIAELVLKLAASQSFPHFVAEHPYNLSFITNQKVIDFFKPLKLLQRA